MPSRPAPRLALNRLEPRDVPAAPFETLPTFNTAEPAVVDHARAIAARDRSLGRNADAFLKIGDSNTAPGFGTGYLFPLGGAYNPAASGLSALHPEVLDTLAAYRGGFNSFLRDSTTGE